LTVEGYCEDRKSLLKAAIPPPRGRTATLGGVLRASDETQRTLIIDDWLPVIMCPGPDDVRPKDSSETLSRCP